jgi:diguanylate cyclase (GGDEF)-like protein/PAS domain S-box-containing protein
MKKKEKISKAKSPDTAKKRKKAEEKLRHEEQRFRAFVEHSSDMIVLLNLEGTITYVNPAIESVLGFKPEERIGAKGFERVHPDDFKFLVEAFNTLAKDTNSPIIQGEMRLRHKDGSWRTLEAVGSNLVNNNVVESIIANYRDITERKRAEGLLLENEERYRTMFENTGTSMILIEEDMTISMANSEFSRNTGYSIDEINGRMKWTELIHPDDLRRMVEQHRLRRESQGGALPGYELHYITKTGDLRDALLSIQLIPGTKKSVASVIDITDRKQTEKNLINSEEKFRTLAESSPFAILMHQGDYWIYANRAAVEISGYTEEELYNMRFWDFVHPDHRNMGKQIGLNRQQGKVVPRAYELKIITKSGEEKWVSLTGNPIQYEDKPTALISATDITERKLAEEKLRFEEQRFRAFVEHSSDMIVVVNRERVITYINPAVERVLGFKPKEWIGIKGSELVHPDDMKLLADSFNTLSRDINTPVIQGAIRLRHKDGSWRTFEAVGSNLINNNVVEAIIVNYRDITERKMAEDALRKSEQIYLELSITDDLTQLYNSRHFYSQLKKEIERSNRYEQPLTLLLLDLDKFKTFNDTYGHVEGDYVLSRLGQVVKRCLRDPDSAYRYGGEEFTIMLPMTTSEEGIITAKRIQKELRREAFSPVLGQEVYMTVSIGLAQYKPKEEMKTFVHRVDQLMYQAKKNGRDRICPES